MQIPKSWRAVVSYSTLAALALNILIGATAISTVHAASSSLVINEINWSGSALSANDTWVELYNRGDVFTATPAAPLTFCAGSTAVFSLTTGTVLPDSYLVVRNSLVTAAQSTLSTAEFAAATPADLSLLPKVSTDLQLVTGTCATPTEVIDTVMGAGTTPAPFMGQDGTAGIFSSMERVGTNGNLAASWMDAYADKTIGKNFDPSVTMQFGTPGTDRVNVLAASNVSLTPLGSAAAGTSVSIQGTVGSSAYAIELTRTAHGVTGAKPELVAPAIQITPDAHNHFLVSSPALTGVNGVNDISVRVLDGAVSKTANRSTLVPVSTELMGDSTYVVYPVTSALATPVFTTTNPTYTQATTLTIAGTATGAAKVVILKSGEYFSTVPVTADAFTTDVLLTPNQLNMFTAVAVAADGTTFSTITPSALMIWQDSIAPAVVDPSKVTLGIGTDGSIVSLKGEVGAVTHDFTDPSNVTLNAYVYADAAKTVLLAGPVLTNNDGSFPVISLLGSSYTTVYITVKDLAGNESAVTTLNNDQYLGGATSPLNPMLVTVTQDQATVKWTAVPNAVSYLVKYKTDGGVFSQAMAQCVGTTTCAYQVTIKGLNPSTKYFFDIAAVDVYGNISTYNELAFTTLQPVPTVVTAAAPEAPLTPAPVVKRAVDKVTTTPAPVAVAPTPTPTATPDTGDVKSSSTDSNTGRNWTPWIILGVLLGVAILAAAGYFYWFGGEAGEAALASSAAAKDRAETAAPITPEKDVKPAAPKKDPKSKSNDKRW